MSHFFKLVYSKPDVTSAADTSCTTDLHLTNLEIDISDVLNAIGQWDVNKNSGEDNVPPLFIKKSQFILSCPLQIIFNKSLDTGKFPDS